VAPPSLASRDRLDQIDDLYDVGEYARNASESTKTEAAVVDMIICVPYISVKESRFVKPRLKNAGLNGDGVTDATLPELAYFLANHPDDLAVTSKMNVIERARPLTTRQRPCYAPFVVALRSP
jgi:hypothetical protein